MSGPTLLGKSETWFYYNWRPATAWLYMSINLFDFIIFPILHAMYAYWTKTPYVPWSPITLQGGGLFHLSFGAIVTTTSYSRGQEKIKELQNAAGVVTPPQ